jgi:hypothetical protein
MITKKLKLKVRKKTWLMSTLFEIISALEYDLNSLRQVYENNNTGSGPFQITPLHFITLKKQLKIYSSVAKELGNEDIVQQVQEFFVSMHSISQQVLREVLDS